MIVRLDGGIGNQLFEYAFGRSVSLARDEELFFEIEQLGLDFPLVSSPRAYSLDAFNVNVQLVATTRQPKYVEHVFSFDKGVYTAPRGMHFVGCWQTEKYFNANVIRKDLTLREPVSNQTEIVASEIQAIPNSAFIHVRRTDYLNPDAAAYHGNMTIDYYKSAMTYICERADEVKFFVFSDDPEWCRQNFEGCRIISHNKMGSKSTGPGKEHEDLYLMSLCKHAIFPNSSFGWWGCWLGDTQTNRICIGPKRWFLGAKLCTDDIIPERWIKL